MKFDEEKTTRLNCPNCGAPIDIHRKDCEYCGTPYERDDKDDKIVFYADNQPIYIHHIYYNCFVETIADIDN